MNKDIEDQTINKAVKQLKLTKNVKWLVILPGMGCIGCIQEGELFLKRNISNPDVFFAITKLNSLKILQQKLGKKIDGLHNVYIDTENVYSFPTSNGIYPCIVQLQSGVAIDHQFQSPQNGQAFEQLELKITYDDQQ